MKTPEQSSQANMITVLVMLVSIPVAVPALGFFFQALIWRYVLSQIDGITFMGSLWEACTLSALLLGFVCLLNVAASTTIYAYKRLTKVPIEKAAEVDPDAPRSWAGLFEVLPGWKSLLRPMINTTLALIVLSHLQPISLHFDTLSKLLLASGVLVAGWHFYLTMITVVLYLVMWKQQLNKKDLRTKFLSG